MSKNSAFPNEICVFGAKIKIIEHKNLYYEGTKVDGIFQSDKRVIFLEKTLPRHEKIHTLIHELGHAVLWRVSIVQCGLAPEVEEMIADTFATLMVETFNLRFKRTGDGQ